MKTLIISLLLIALLFNICSAQSGWYPANDSTSGYTMNKIHFTSASTGYCIGYNGSLVRTMLLKTTNGGTNWFTAGYLNNFCGKDFSFVNDLTGYTTGGNSYSNYLYFYKTTNGGSNWIFLDSLRGSYNIVGADYYTRLDFFNENIGLIRSSLSYCYKTSNGGQNWLAIPDSGWFMDNPIKVKFLSSDFIVLFQSAKQGYSTNGGLTWHNISPSMNTYDFSFINGSTGYSVAKYYNSTTDIVQKTTNGGLNWNEVFQCTYTPVTCPLMMKVCFVNEQTGYKSGYPGCIFKTTNGGINWNLQASFPYVTNNLYFLNANTGFCASSRGVILKTVNGGVSVRNISSEIPDMYVLRQNYPNPFNPVTSIVYSIKKSSAVMLKVYDALGKEVQTLVNEKQSAGTYEATFDASAFSSGVYYYRLTADGYRETRKMVLIK